MRPKTIVIHAVILFLILLLTLSPVISVALASEIAAANGCTLNESQAHPCFIGGVDRGTELYTLGMLGWFMLVTLPIGGLIFGLYLLALVGYGIWRKIRQTNRPPTTTPHT